MKNIKKIIIPILISLPIIILLLFLNKKHITNTTNTISNINKVTTPSNKNNNEYKSNFNGENAVIYLGTHSQYEPFTIILDKKLSNEDLAKDIIQKIEQKGYEVTKCKVEAQIANKNEETKINSIRVMVEKNERNKAEETKKEESEIENKIVTEIQKIKKVNISIKNDKDENVEENDIVNSTDDKITISDIQNIKKFLIDEYGVEEKCLKIN